MAHNSLHYPPTITLFFFLRVAWVLGLQHILIKIVMITKLFPLYEVGGFITSPVGTILAETSV